MVEEFHGGGEMGESRHLEAEEPKITDEGSRHLKHICQDKTQRKLDTHKFTQVEFLYSKCVVIYKRGDHLFVVTGAM